MGTRRFQGMRREADSQRASDKSTGSSRGSHGMQADQMFALQASIGNQATMDMMEATPSEPQDNLKSGIENLSGFSMDDVKIHRHSDKPAQLNAHAYAQGTDIHVASGQEQHLPHEAWHVVQQKQGRGQRL